MDESRSLLEARLKRSFNFAASCERDVARVARKETMEVTSICKMEFSLEIDVE